MSNLTKHTCGKILGQTASTLGESCSCSAGITFEKQENDANIEGSAGLRNTKSKLG